MSKPDSDRYGDLHGCCAWTARVTEFLQDELDLCAADRFEEHLPGCARCADALAAQRSTLERLESMRDTVSLPACSARRTVARVLERAEAEARPSGSSRLTRAAAVLCAASLVVMLASRWMDPGSGSDSKTGAGDARQGATVAIPLPGEAASAVRRGLGWLVSVQDENGGWDPGRWGGRTEYSVGVSGLAVLALSRGDTSAHREAAARGARFLLSSRGRDGLLGGSFRGGLYNHAVATRALLEVWSHADDEMREEMDRAVHDAIDRIVESQSAAGFWSYPGTEGASGGVSISAWPLRCLVVARKLGWRRLDAPVERSFRWLERSALLEEGSAAVASPIRGAGHDGHLCAAVDDALGWLVHDGSDRLIRLRRRALDRLALEKVEPTDYYRSYLVSRALDGGDEAWKKGRRGSAARQLLSRQETEGSFVGSWTPEDRWSALGGRLCSTALATLALDTPL